MGFEMIDRYQRQGARRGNCFARRETDQQPAEQPWPGRCGHPVNIAPSKICFVHGLFDEFIQHLYMGARRNLGHNAPEGRVLIELRAHQVR